MKQFTSIEKLDTAILYLLELASSLSVLLLAFGLIASMANVLTKGAVLTDNLFMQRVWAWTQCIAIDAGLAGTILRTFRYHQEGEKVKTWIYGLLSALLLFTAAIVSNIEAVQQTLNISLQAAYVHVFVPVEALIWIRSVAIVLLIVAHALRHTTTAKQQEPTQVQQPEPQQPAPLTIAPELIAALREMLQTSVNECLASRSMLDPHPLTTVIEEQKEPPQIEAPKEQEITLENPEQICEPVSQEQPIFIGQFASKEAEIAAILKLHPNAAVEEVAELAHCHIRTAAKWVGKLRTEG